MGRGIKNRFEITTLMKHIKVVESGCWEWQAGRQRFGYGTIEIDGKKWTAHRLSWALHHGREPTLWILHHCDNPPCCNPDHLYEGTPADNHRDSVERGRARCVMPTLEDRRKPRLNKLTDAEVIAIARSTEPVEHIAWRYRCSMGHVSQIRNGHRKSKVTGIEPKPVRRPITRMSAHPA
jgi:hypothetical protein